jgi:hypothetical protein
MHVAQHCSLTQLGPNSADCSHAPSQAVSREAESSGTHRVGTVNLLVLGVIHVGRQHWVPPANPHDPAV